MATLFDYLPSAALMLDEGLDALRAARWDSIADQYDARREAMGAKGRMDTVYKPCPPELLYLDGAAWDAALSPRRVIRLQAAPAAPGPGVLDAGGRMGRSFAPERQSGANVFDALAAHIAARRKAGAVVLASHSEGARETVARPAGKTMARAQPKISLPCAICRPSQTGCI